MVLITALYALVLAILGLALRWVTLLAAVAPAGGQAPADPYEAQVREFRRQVADWDGAR